MMGSCPGHWATRRATSALTPSQYSPSWGKKSVVIRYWGFLGFGVSGGLGGGVCLVFLKCTHNFFYT